MVEGENKIRWTEKIFSMLKCEFFIVFKVVFFSIKLYQPLQQVGSDICRYDYMQMLFGPQNKMNSGLLSLSTTLLQNILTP